MRTLSLLIGLTVGLQACNKYPEVPSPERPATWATPIETEQIRNLHRVTKDLYRGAQPDEEGMAELERLGIRTILNLRNHHTNEEELEGRRLKSMRVRMSPTDVRDEHVVAFLKIVTDPANLPVFVHCQYGSDRTGVICAAWRIVVQAWTKEEALREMQGGGFGAHAIYEGMPKYIRSMDVAKIRAAAGLR